MIPWIRIQKANFFQIQHNRIRILSTARGYIMYIFLDDYNAEAMPNICDSFSTYFNPYHPKLFICFLLKNIYFPQSYLYHSGPQLSSFWDLNWIQCIWVLNCLLSGSWTVFYLDTELSSIWVLNWIQCILVLIFYLGPELSSIWILNCLLSGSWTGSSVSLS